MASVHHHHLLLLLLSIVTPVAAAQPRGNITLNSSLSASSAGNLSWLSPSGDFAFGFLPLPTNPSLFLLAVYFADLPDNTTTVIWSPNRNKPVDANSTVILTPDGHLSLRDPSGAEVWNPGNRTAAYASMLDTGDFALAAANGSFLWDTFASPTDTIVPSQSLGPNSQLISKLAAADFSDGRFKLAVQNGDGDLIFYPIAVPTGFEYTPYWSSNSNTANSKLVFNTSGSIDVVSPTGELITTLTSATMKSTADFYHRGTLDPDGVFRHYVHPKPSAADGGAAEWTVADFKPADICRVLLTKVGSGACGFNSFCGYDNKGMVACQCPERYSWVDPNRTYMGCKPDFAMPSCIAGVQGGAFRMARVDNFDFWGEDYDQFNPMEEAECEQQCMDDCFCAASIHDGISTCWKKKLPFSNGRKGSYVDRTAFIKVGKGTIPILSVSEKRNWSFPGSLALGGSVLLNLTFLSAIFVVLRVSKRKQRKKLKDSILEPKLKLFTYEELEKATNGFGEELGRGACGTVYKGYLGPELTGAPDIAVKKLRDFQPEMEKEFVNEVKSIGQTHHKNLVQLLGYCNQGAERLLVYEYLSNGSLASYLFDGALPPWEQRVEIMLGIARGLRYLHDECGAQIIHCDIKPQNVLLDGSFVARIADFGLAKLLRTDQTRTNTGIRGTKGYVAPEWFKSSGITAKVDVYSFGVMVLEIVCCRRNVEKEVGEEKAVLAFWASDCYRDGMVDLLVEGDLEAMGDMGRVERFVKVALWCVEEDPRLRPTMALVTQMLEGAVEIPSPESHTEM